MVIKGLKEIQEKSAEIEVFVNQNRMNYVFIGDGDSAVVRFISDDEMLQTKMHEYEEMAPTGKKYRKAYCLDNLVGAACKWCAVGNIPKNVYVFLVYLYYIIHKNQNPMLNTNPDAVKWDTFNQGQAILYKEEVNEIRVLRTKWGKDGYIKNSILGFVEEYGTLCDRDYKFSRAGTSLKTLYSFVPKDPSAEPAEVTQAKVDVSSIEEVVIGNRGKETQANLGSSVAEKLEEPTSEIDDNQGDLF